MKPENPHCLPGRGRRPTQIVHTPSAGGACTDVHTWLVLKLIRVPGVQPLLDCMYLGGQLWPA